MKNVVIAGYARSPFTPAKRGELVKTRPDELAAQVVKGLVEDCIKLCSFNPQRIKGPGGIVGERTVAVVADRT